MPAKATVQTSPKKKGKFYGGRRKGIPNVNPAQKKKVLQLYLKGVSQADISRLMGIGAESVSRVVNQEDVQKAIRDMAYQVMERLTNPSVDVLEQAIQGKGKIKDKKFRSWLGLDLLTRTGVFAYLNREAMEMPSVPVHPTLDVQAVTLSPLKQALAETVEHVAQDYQQELPDRESMKKRSKTSQKLKELDISSDAEAVEALVED